MQITSQHRLEVMFERTPYADTFTYIQNFKPKKVRFQNIFYNLDHILYSHTCCEWVFYITDFNNEHFALFYLPTFPPPKATPKLSEILYTDIVYTVNLDAIPAITVSVPTLSLFLIVIPTSTNYKFIIAIIAPLWAKDYRHYCVP